MLVLGCIWVAARVGEGGGVGLQFIYMVNTIVFDSIVRRKLQHMLSLLNIVKIETRLTQFIFSVAGNLKSACDDTSYFVLDVVFFTKSFVTIKIQLESFVN